MTERAPMLTAIDHYFVSFACPTCPIRVLPRAVMGSRGWRSRHIVPRMGVGEDWHAGINVVVDLDAGLARIGTEHPTHVLHDPSFELHREHEEDSVQRRAVEPLADVWTGSNGQERWPVVGDL